jgi:hypothetical protein
VEWILNEYTTVIPTASVLSSQQLLLVRFDRLKGVLSSGTERARERLFW